MPADEQIEAACAAYDNFAMNGDGDPHRHAMRAALEAAERVAWRDIAEAPDDRQVAVWCPAREGLDELMSFCRYHPDAGFCVDELREPTLYRIVEPPQ